MTADTIGELHAMADKIGLKRFWFQSRSIPHYDLRPSKRQAALMAGAVEITSKEMVMKAKRDKRDIGN